MYEKHKEYQKIQIDINEKLELYQKYKSFTNYGEGSAPGWPALAPPFTRSPLPYCLPARRCSRECAGLITQRTVDQNHPLLFAHSSNSGDVFLKGENLNINQVYQRIAHEAIRGAARAAITAMKNHRGYRTRPSAMSADNGGRTAN